MEQQLYVDMGSNSFFGDYLYDQVVPQDHFLRKLKKSYLLEPVHTEADQAI